MATVALRTTKNRRYTFEYSLFLILDTIFARMAGRYSISREVRDGDELSASLRMFSGMPRLASEHILQPAPWSCFAHPSTPLRILHHPLATGLRLLCSHLWRPDLYLVRLWRGKGRKDGAMGTHGKLQHVVSGATSYFDKLSDLPEALEKMMGQEAGPVVPDAGDTLAGELYGPDER